MAKSKFTDETRKGLVDRTRAGVSLADASRDLDLRLPTVKSWITRGRRGQEGYAEFVEELDAARAEADARPEPLTEDEHARLVAKAARKGSVSALKLAWEMICANRDAEEAEEPSNPLGTIDELAQRRAS